MLSSRNRMRRSSEFGSVLRAGRRSARGAVAVVYLAPPADAAEPADPPRVGFVVSKAVGGAVVRKRVQRRLRHAMRTRLAVLPNGSLLVVRAKPAAATTRQAELDAHLDSAIAAAMRPRTSRRRRGRGGSSASAAEPAGDGTAPGRVPDGGGERTGR
ncbi:ribonuclease P protein component [Nocardiopsis sp. CNR-923]|uniref:ribonuclease P protein component n=1 Tax=Nocardiopsis sp. CNR-923 TaxID=1904965 RepID=UPI00095E165D|nr:ribonuclease P protein component [Nocardiopsis sp. CNR-923]OLT30761.1 ribonuclease P protein component [Nocardiopsis sp. CNR-923]